MVRLIKRYGSRKLYDTEESRYVTLDELVAWIRAGQNVRIVDNASDEDVTTPVLTQIIAEQGRRGSFALPTEALHEIIRRGEATLRSGVEQLQHGVEKLLGASLERLSPVREARGEMALLRARIQQLESALADVEVRSRAARSASRRPRRKTS